MGSCMKTTKEGVINSDIYKIQERVLRQQPGEVWDMKSATARADKVSPRRLLDKQTKGW